VRRGVRRQDSAAASRRTILVELSRYSKAAWTVISGLRILRLALIRLLPACCFRYQYPAASWMVSSLAPQGPGPPGNWRNSTWHQHRHRTAREPGDPSLCLAGLSLWHAIEPHNREYFKVEREAERETERGATERRRNAITESAIYPAIAVRGALCVTRHCRRAIPVAKILLPQVKKVVAMNTFWVIMRTLVPKGVLSQAKKTLIP